MSNYSDKLKNPRWQKKRLEILERDNYICQFCGHDDFTLVVHHKYYDKTIEPWDYPNEALITLCEYCHKDETEKRDDYEKQIIALMRNSFSVSSLKALIFYLKRIPSNENGSTLMNIITYPLDSNEMYALIFTLTNEGIDNPKYLSLIRYRISNIYDKIEEYYLERKNA
jgi:hypothetical protein